MPDLTPDVTTTPNFDPGRVAIASGWLVYDVGYHTCGGYSPESGYAHEPGCGAEPICKVADIPDLLAAAAERDASSMKHGSLFSGYGGIDRAIADVFGAETAWCLTWTPARMRSSPTATPTPPTWVTSPPWTGRPSSPSTSSAAAHPAKT